jgi:hypothetical protein
MNLPDPAPDLERIAGDLADVERALERLDDGSYWTDEVTAEPIPDDVHAEDPTARRVTRVPTDPTAAGTRDTSDPPADE